MKAERLLEQYEKIAESPDAIPKLRRFILDLAIRGKLVPQDPNDESAEELLKRIDAKKKWLINEGVVKPDNKKASGKKQTEDVDLPFGWAATQLAFISNRIHYGYTASADAAIRNVRLLRITDIQDNSVNWDSVPGCIIDSDDVGQYQLVKGDILIARTGGTIGKTFLVSNAPVTAVFASYLIRVQPTKYVYDRYLKSYFESSLYWDQLRDGSRGTGQPNVNGQTLGGLFVPLPPLAEQQRIVAKMDELMGICDRLEVARKERESIRDGFTTSTLGRLSVADESTFRSDASFAIEHLRELTTRPDQIKQLRQTILNLAVRGKLVPQDPNDEPASELLKRIKFEKRNLVIQRKTRQADDVEYSDIHKSCVLPPGWLEVSVNDVAIIQGGKRLPSRAVFSEEPTSHVYIRVTDMKNGTITRTGLKYISPQIHQFLSRYIINKEDLYITIAGTIGEVGTVPEYLDGQNLTENAAKIVFRGFDRRFFQLALMSGLVQSQFVEKTKQMAQPKLALKRIAGAKFFLPPLKEQHRIVKKAEQWSSICTKLESILVQGEERRRRFIDLMLVEL